MPQVAHPSWIEIDLKQFKANIALVRSQIGKALYCLPVKANAYGHGLEGIGRAAQEAGVDYLAVAHLQEGIQLRNAGIAIPILVLGAIHEDQIRDLINYHLEFTISSLYKAELVARVASGANQSRCRVHIEVDTGMQRTGVRPATAVALYQALQQANCFDVVGIYSHFATADLPGDLFAQEQLRRFEKLAKESCFQNARPPLIWHMANSGGLAFLPQSYLQMVRPALITFGHLPEGVCVPAPLKQVRPCFTLKTKVAYFKVVEAGQGISYGHRFTTPQRTRIVTLPIGYGDGYRRSLSNRAEVLIRGKRYPIVGTICMDQFMVDIGQDEVHVGEEVVLIGRQGQEEITLQEMAHLCDTIPYEVLCLFNNRLPRIFIE